MGPEELKTLSEGGAWLVLAGVLIWIINYLLKQAAHERKEQHLQHRKERASILMAHRAERKAWQEASEKNADRIAETVRDAIRNRP